MLTAGAALGITSQYVNSGALYYWCFDSLNLSSIWTGSTMDIGSLRINYEKGSERGFSKRL